MSEKERKKNINKQCYIKRKIIAKAKALNEQFTGIKVCLHFKCGLGKEDQIQLEARTLNGSEEGSYLLLRNEILIMGEKFVAANPMIKEQGQLFLPNIDFQLMPPIL